MRPGWLGGSKGGMDGWVGGRVVLHVCAVDLHPLDTSSDVAVGG